VKQRVALAIALAGLVSGICWATAAGAGGPSLSGARPQGDLTIRVGQQDVPLICLDGVIDVDDDLAHARGVDCPLNQLNDQDEPPAIDMRPVDVEILDT